MPSVLDDDHFALKAMTFNVIESLDHISTAFKIDASAGVVIIADQSKLL